MEGLRSVSPVVVVDLFPEERTALLGLLRSLSSRDWAASTICEGWTVKDLTAHLLGDDLGRLSRHRDGLRPAAAQPGDRLVSVVNRLNEEWVTAMRRLSPRMLCELLEASGAWTQQLFASLDLQAVGEAVSWAGPDPAPVWLDVAREYTERWHHHQQIREAVGAPLLTQPRFLRPVLATFVHALPHALGGAVASDGAAVELTIRGPSGGTWTAAHERGRWRLYSGTVDAPWASVVLPEDLAWRLFTRGVTPSFAQDSVEADGDQELVSRVLDAVAIIA